MELKQTYLAAENRYERAAMMYARCGRSGVLLPKISLGFWHNFGSVDPYERARAITHYAFDNGITHFDLANNYGPVYGSAEETMGKLIDDDFRRYRDELFISTKAGYDMWPGPYGEWGSRKYLMASIDQSLRRMHLDYVDLFYSHRFDPETPIEETLQAMVDIVRAGKALYLGISNWPLEPLQKAEKYLRERDVPLLIYQFLRPEMLTPQLLTQLQQLNAIATKRGQTLAQMALQWILKQQGVTSVLVGASSVEQLQNNLQCIAEAEKMDF